MMRNFCLVILALLIPLMAFALDTPAKHTPEPVPLATGTEEVNAPVTMPPYPMAIPDGTDMIGDTVSVGTTWYESQHNGTVGRMIELDENGYVHFVWMNGTNSGATDRHVYYNFVDPEGVQGYPGIGTPVESSTRAGYAVLDVDWGGICFPGFHESTTNANFHAAVGSDFGPHLGAFLTSEPNWIMENGTDLQAIWPRMMFDSQQVLHMVTTHSHGIAAHPQRQWYITGTYNSLSFMMDFDEEWQLVGWTNDIAADVATSDVSNRVAVGWMYCLDPAFPDTNGGATYAQMNNDIHLLIDDDGVDLNFNDYFNLTQYAVANTAWLPDTALADMDTVRAYTDMNVFIDQDDWVHVAFTARSYMELEGTTYWHPSIIWHWSEQFPGEFQMIHDAFDDWDWNYVDCGAWQVKAQNPELGQDPETGYLYCMYQVYDVDTTAISAGGWPSGDIYMSMSADGGQNWSVGINITNTTTASGAPAGQCWSELTPSMAKVVDGTCHIMYVVDRDAGFVVQTEGTWTLNPVIYHTVSVDDIPSTPLVPQWPEPGSYPFHVEQAPAVGIPGAGRYEVASEFDLAQNYPNPFNPTTTIQFSLDQVSVVQLQIFNLKGELVATAAEGTFGTGQHQITFDGSGLSSGVYIYRLDDGVRSISKKMLLMK